jgi:hypothetical protein
MVIRSSDITLDDQNQRAGIREPKQGELAMKRSVTALISVVALAAGAMLLPVSGSQAQMRQTQMR